METAQQANMLINIGDKIENRIPENKETPSLTPITMNPQTNMEDLSEESESNTDLEDNDLTSKHILNTCIDNS